MIFPVDYIAINSSFGKRTFTLNGKEVTDFHWGTDFGKHIIANVPVYAVADGVVVDEGKADDGAIFCIIYHEKLNAITRYWHLSKTIIDDKQVVYKGQQIGNMGSTGKYTSGPHLHFEVWTNLPLGYKYNADDRNTYAVNPLAVLKLTKTQTIKPTTKYTFPIEEDNLDVENSQLQLELKLSYEKVENLEDVLEIEQKQLLKQKDEIAFLNDTIKNKDAEISYLNNQLGSVIFKYVADKDGYFKIKLYRNETLYIKG